MKKLLSLFLILAFVFVSSPPIVFAVDGDSLGVGVITDIHYFPAELTGDYCPAFLKYCENNTRQHGQSVSLLDSALYALAEHAEEKSIKYLLIPGDLSHDGEYEAHRILAQKLELFEIETGIQVIVVNGNHDINNFSAATFENGVKEEAKRTSAEDWLYLYRNLGYDIAYNTYTPPQGKKAGMLSYSVQLDGGYRLIVMDCEKYSSDSTSDGEDERENSGNCPEDLMQWVLAEMEDANACGEKIIGMTHHSVAPHFDIQPTVTSPLLLNNWLETSEALANGGMRYVFTGHTHMSDIASAVSDSGETITDIMTASLTGYPNTFREVVFSHTDDSFTAQISTIDPDCELPITYLGTTYEQPYKNTFGFGQSFGHDGLAQYGTNAAYDYISGFLEEMNDKGISQTLQDSGMNLDEPMAGFVELLAERLMELYLNDPQNLYNIINNAVVRLCDIPVSEESCTKFIGTLGFGTPDRGGNFGEFGSSLIAYLFGGDEYIDDDPFMTDALAKLKSGELTDDLLDVISSIIIDDLFGSALPSLLLPPSALEAKDASLQAVQLLLIEMFGESSYYLFEDLFAPGSGSLSASACFGRALSIYADSIDLKNMLAFWVESLITDSNPGVKQDSEVLLTYAGPVAVEATAENGRLPSDIAVEAGGSDTEKIITWLTKYSVEGTDIEILPDDGTPFTGTPSANVLSGGATHVTHSYYALELLPDSGFLSYDVKHLYHSTTVYGLEEDTVYRFRVGDASKDWWSEESTFNTLSSETNTVLSFLSELIAILSQLQAILEAISAIIPTL